MTGGSRPRVPSTAPLPRDLRPLDRPATERAPRTLDGARPARPDETTTRAPVRSLIPAAAVAPALLGRAAADRQLVVGAVAVIGLGRFIDVPYAWVVAVL